MSKLRYVYPESDSSVGDFPVKTSPQQGRAKGSRAVSRASGLTSAASPKSSTRASSSSKTSQAVDDVGCPSCGETCTCWGIEAVPLEFLPSTAERPTCADVCSFLLPIPSASSYGTNRGGAAGRVGTERPSLQTMARRGLLPTPVASANANRMRSRPPSHENGSHGRMLAAEINVMVRDGLLPTPTVKGNYNRKGASPRAGDGLATAMKAGGPLNPTWVEILMGFPAGWTRRK